VLPVAGRARRRADGTSRCRPAARRPPPGDGAGRAHVLGRLPHPPAGFMSDHRGSSNNFALIVVLFILLIIVGASFMY
jgi:uncharacterized protein (TIGR01732 family)